MSTPTEAPQLGHVGWPVDETAAADRTRRGLPVYWPTDPKQIDQRNYVRFATERGPNTA